MRWCWILIPSCYGVGGVECVVGRRGCSEDENVGHSDVDVVEVVPVTRRGRIPRRDRRTTLTMSFLAATEEQLSPCKRESILF
jgi:hypothetical protein